MLFLPVANKSWNTRNGVLDGVGGGGGGGGWCGWNGWYIHRLFLNKFFSLWEH